ncbi:MAG: hypothetical protein ACSLFP_08530 [Acidimicrobiales bacterium]
MTDRRRRLRAAVFVCAILPANVFVLVLATTTATAGVQATTNACKSNATATYSDLVWTLAGEASPDPATLGEGDITLGGSTLSVSIPATLLIAGYNLGLLTTGANNIPTTVYVARSAVNVVGGTATQVDNFSITASTTITDPNGIPGTGDETATPLAVSEPLPNMVVTPTGGDVTFRQAAPGSIGSVPLGAGGAPLAVAGSLFAQASVAGGLIKANFDCSPGTTNIDPPGGTSGPTFAPAASITPFETVTVSGGTSTTPSTTSSTSTTSTSTTSTSTTSTTASTVPGPTTTTTAPPGATSVTGTETFTATCSNSVTPDMSELTFAITGTAPTQAVAGDIVTLSDQSWTVNVPGSVLQTGINLGLLNFGDVVAGSVTPSLFATNTEEGLRTLSPVAVQIGPIENDGTSSAKPASATFAVPDTSWTTVGGTVGYSLGAADVEVSIGPLKVAFKCTPVPSALAVVQTNVSGSTGVPPAGRPGLPGTEVLGEQVGGPAAGESGTEALPRTGAELLVPVALAVGLLDLGYLLESAVRPARRRRRPDAWT